MTHMKKSLLSIALFVCGLLLWKPVQAEAATQVDNLVLMVNFSKDGDNTFQTNFSRYQEMYTGPESEPNRSLSQYISTDRKSTRLNSSHDRQSRMPSSA